MLSVVVGITAMAWSVSAEREHRYKMPEVRLESMDLETDGGIFSSSVDLTLLGTA
jgi:hypothetical protein